jgi:ribose transport system ATP-binding protein
MIGRDLKSLYIAPAQPPREIRLEVSNARTAAWPSKSISLGIRGGEILGLAGLIGAGRTELARAIFGVDRLLGGELTLDGQPFAVGEPRDSIARGIFLVPEDRRRCGLILESSISENISLPNLAKHSVGGLVREAGMTKDAERQKTALSIRAPDVQTPAQSLSGGNQQKVVLAKWLSLNPNVLICDEPTRGVDVGAKQEIYQIMRALADSGVAILMISSDMEEVIGVSDRIAVMHEGSISGFLERDQFSEHKVMSLAVGAGST